MVLALNLRQAACDIAISTRQARQIHLNKVSKCSRGCCLASFLQFGCHLVSCWDNTQLKWVRSSSARHKQSFQKHHWILINKIFVKINKTKMKILFIVYLETYKISQVIPRIFLAAQNEGLPFLEQLCRSFYFPFENRIMLSHFTLWTSSIISDVWWKSSCCFSAMHRT